MDHDRTTTVRADRWRRLGIALTLVVVSAVPFLPTLGNGFAGWDDTVNFLANRDFRGLGARNVWWAWTTYLMGVYQPLGWMIYEAEYVAWGLEPRWYHLVSIAFHAANALALWAFTCAVLGPVGRAAGQTGDGGWSTATCAAVAVAFYAIHPLRVEAVAWASCQSYLPGIFFGLLSLTAYLKAFERDPDDGRLVWVVVAWLLYAVALLTKVAVIGLPFVLLILDMYPLRRVGPGRWAGPAVRGVYREKLAFLALSVPFMVVAVQARWPAETRPSVGPADLVPRLAQSAYGVWFYPIKTVFPFGLSALYPLPARPRSYARWPFLVSAAAVILAGVAAWRLRRRFPGLVAAWCCYLVCLTPSLGLIRTSLNLAADRYSYVPSMAGVVVLAYALTRIGTLPWARRFAPIILALLILCLSALSWRQSLTWRSTETLWVQCGLRARPHHDSRLKAGRENYRRGRTEDAKRQFLQALTDFPGSVPALQSLGEISWREGDLNAAAEMWVRAWAAQPDSVEGQAGLEIIRARRSNGPPGGRASVP